MTRIPRSVAVCAALLAAAPLARGAEPGAGAPDAKATLERLKGLAGEWEGEAGHAGGPMSPAKVRWETISGGTAVMETLFPGSEHEMRSVYHLDGKDLVLTHYCAMGNQPRMKLARKASREGELVFEFAGGTNLDPAKDGHIHSGKLRLVSPDALEAEWAFYAGGKRAGSNRFVLARKR